MKKSKLSLKNIFIVTLFANNIIYSENINIGEELYFSKGCSNCHGTDGKGLNSYPSISGKPFWDTKRKLLKLKAGIELSSRSQIMIPFAKSLTDTEIDEVSTALQNLKRKNDENKFRTPREIWGDGGS